MSFNGTFNRSQRLVKDKWCWLSLMIAHVFTEFTYDMSYDVKEIIKALVKKGINIISV